MRMGMQAVHQLALSVMIIPVLFACGGLHPRAAQATTYYVATNGSDSSPGTQLQPFRTIQKGISALTRGDTLYIRGGSYAESIIWYQQTLPSGTSWSNPITIAGYPNETVALNGKLDISSGNPLEQKYLILRDFILDVAGQQAAGAYIGVQYVRLQNLEIKNYGGPGVGAGVQVSSDHNEFLNLRVHNSTSVRLHGFYVWGADNLFDGIESFNNSGYGMQFYNGNGDTVHRNIIRNCRIHDNGNSTNPGGIVISHGDSNQVYNNVIYNNTNGASGLDISYNATNTKAYYNTIYNNISSGIYVGPGTIGSVLRNNIIFKNNPNINDQGSGTTLSHNYTSDPQFINAAVGDFHLQSGSPAKTASDSGGEVGAYGGGSSSSPPISQFPAPKNIRVLSVAP